MERGSFPRNQFTLIQKFCFMSIILKCPHYTDIAERTDDTFFFLPWFSFQNERQVSLQGVKKKISPFNMIKNRSCIQYLHGGWLSTYNFVSEECLHRLSISSGLPTIYPGKTLNSERALSEAGSLRGSVTLETNSNAAKLSQGNLWLNW